MDLATKLKLTDVEVNGKRVVMRVDFNVPQDKTNPAKITNTARIEAALPSIQYCTDNGASAVILLSHLGRPDGRVTPTFSMRFVAPELERLLSRPIRFLPDCVGPDVEAACARADGGSIILCENVRFHAEEEGKGLNAEGKTFKPDAAAVRSFRASLARLGDLYVNDAFGTSHRAHSSMLGEGFQERVAGLLVARELEAFSRVLDTPRRPFLAIVGGAKVSDKIKVISNLLERVDQIIIGGGMAFTFLAVARGMQIGNSLFDEEGAKLVPDILAKADERSVTIILPTDFVTSSKLSPNRWLIGHATVESGIKPTLMGLDCGPASRTAFTAAIQQAGTILWNGPLGVFELKPFSKGTRAVATAIAEATRNGATTVVGGGDTATACALFGVENAVTHVSTGGGASLELLEGRDLPGIAALSQFRRNSTWLGSIALCRA